MACARDFTSDTLRREKGEKDEGVVVGGGAHTRSCLLGNKGEKSALLEVQKQGGGSKKEPERDQGG